MLVVGVTGGIGCGKSLVSDLFQDLYNSPVIDADVISRQLTQTSLVLEKISKQLGPEYLDENKQLLRKKLRNDIFTHPKIRITLEKILHPLVYNEIRKSLDHLDSPYCLVVIPLLFEKERTEFLDRILVIDCTIREQISRVAKRDQCKEELVKDIIGTQIDRTSRLALADDIIQNSGSILDVKDKTALLHNKYIELSHQMKST